MKIQLPDFLCRALTKSSTKNGEFINVSNSSIYQCTALDLATTWRFNNIWIHRLAGTHNHNCATVPSESKLKP